MIGEKTMDTIIDNQQKYENYAEQFRRLNKALTNGFNLEAMFIAYAIMEDRTESILRHAGYWDAYMKKRGNRDATINSKITYIQGKVTAGDKLLRKYFSDDLLARILAWKEERNRLIHALLKQQLTDEEVVRIAEEGNKLVRTIRSRTTSYNRAVEKARKTL
jgi:hypothetical protein